MNDHIGKDLIIFVILILLIGVVYFAEFGDITGRIVVTIGRNACSDEKVVYRMNALENAHAAFPNTPNTGIYDIEVCLEDASNTDRVCRDASGRAIDPGN